MVGVMLDYLLLPIDQGAAGAPATGGMPWSTFIAAVLGVLAYCGVRELRGWS